MIRPVIVFASFGASTQEMHEKSIAPIIREIGKAFPNFVIVEAYTSAFIRRRLKNEGIEMLSLEEQLEELCQKGVREVYVQPAHLTPGEEYEKKILEAAKLFYARFAVLKVGEPVFFRQNDTKNDDIACGLSAIFPDLASDEEEAVVLLGHGSPHRHNPIYMFMQEWADEQGLPIHIGVIEETDTPNFAMVLERLRKSGKKHVLLAPLLLTSGIHIIEDMAGDTPESWKNRLRQAGFFVRLDMHSLGERTAFRHLYIKKLKRLIGENS